MIATLVGSLIGDADLARLIGARVYPAQLLNDPIVPAITFEIDGDRVWLDVWAVRKQHLATIDPVLRRAVPFLDLSAPEWLRVEEAAAFVLRVSAPWPAAA